MTDAVDADIAELRRLAQEGRNAPLVSGRYLVSGAGLSALALTGMYIFSRQEGAPWIWIATWVGAMAVGAVLMRRFNGQVAALPGGRTAVGRMEGAVWTYGGAAIFVFAIGVMLRMALGLETPPIAGGLIGTVALLVYAIAFLTSAEVSAQKWLRIPGFACFGAAAVVALAAHRLESLVLTAAFVAALGVIPGLLLMRAEKRGA